MNEIKGSLKKLKLYVMLEKLINSVILAWLLAVVLDLIFILLSKIVYFHKPFVIVLSIHIACFFIGLLIFIKEIPNFKALIKIADSLGFKERFLTAIELSEKKELDEIEKMQIKDTIKIAEQADFKSLYRFNIKKKAVMSSFVVLIFVIVGYFLPTPFEKNLENQRKEILKIEEAVQIIEETEKGINNDRIMNCDEKTKLLKQLKKNIRLKRDNLKALEMIKESEISLKEITDNEKIAQEKISEILKENESLNQLGEAVENNDSESINEEIENIKEVLSQASEQELEKMTEALKKASQEAEGELKEALKQVSDKLEDYENNSEAVKNSLDKLNAELVKQADVITENEKENENINIALKNAKAEMGEGEKVELKQENTEKKASNENSRGSGHIDNGNGEKNDNKNSLEDFQIKSKENKTDTQGEWFKAYAQGENNDSITQQESILKYKKEAYEGAKNGDMSNSDKEIVKKYFSDLR